MVPAKKYLNRMKYRCCDSMDKVGVYDVQPFTKARQDITVISQEGKRRLNVSCVNRG